MEGPRTAAEQAVVGRKHEAPESRGLTFSFLLYPSTDSPEPFPFPERETDNSQGWNPWIKPSTTPGAEGVELPAADCSTPSRSDT